jgi:proline iminopeptidase
LTPYITCPTFIIVGKKDWINLPSQAKEMRALIPNSKLMIVPESGHFIWVDQKEKYFAAITSFLKELIFS